MAKSVTAGGEGELVHHINAIRMRINGSGSFQMQLNSLHDVNQSTLIPFTLAIVTAVEPTRLANFKSQRIQLEFRVTEIDEWFQIRRIVIFSKPVETGYPSYMDT